MFNNPNPKVAAEQLMAAWRAFNEGQKALAEGIAALPLGDPLRDSLSTIANSLTVQTRPLLVAVQDTEGRLPKP